MREIERDWFVLDLSTGRYHPISISEASSPELLSVLCGRKDGTSVAILPVCSLQPFGDIYKTLIPLSKGRDKWHPPSTLSAPTGVPYVPGVFCRRLY